MSERLADIIDQSLTRLQAGEPVESILSDFPGRRDELAPLLSAARALSPLRAVPPPADSEAGLAAFLGEAQEMRAEMATERSPWRGLVRWLAALREWWWRPQVRLAAGALCTLLLLVVFAGGTLMLAADSLPGNALYAVKLAGEEVRLALTFDQAAQAEYQLERVQMRATEIQLLVQAGLPVDEMTLARMDRSLEASLIAVAAADLQEIPRLLEAVEATAAEQTRLFALASATAVDAGTRQRLGQARLSMMQVGALASAGRADVHAFRLDARLGTFHFGAGEGRPTSTPAVPGVSTATAMATATRTPRSTPIPTGISGPKPTSSGTLAPTLAGTATVTPGAPDVSGAPTATGTPHPSGADQSATPETRTATAPPTAYPATATARPVTPTPQPFIPTSTSPPVPTSTPVPVPTSTPVPAPTATPEPAPTSTPAPTHQPPGLTDTPQPPGQTKTPKPTKSK